jgi:diketogulonate reductase-like aldo/keto reductase
MPQPTFIYGTAWKKERTADLVALALEAGFRAIDTANQRKHYHEAGVGEALRRVGIARDALFLQSKFTYEGGQDHRLPYDPKSPLATQVADSFASSLEHLGTDYLDSYVLHGPSGDTEWSADDRAVWGAMETLHAEGKTKVLGVSNISLAQLEELVANAQVQPSFVQNRCYASDGWGRAERSFCSRRGIIYQGFSLLTANRKELAMPLIPAIAKRHDATVAQVVFRFAQLQGMLPLTGTSSQEHMALDLACNSIELSEDELHAIESIAG